MREDQLKVSKTYKERTGNTFTLIHEYHPNHKCFKRQDGNLHFGREFIGFKDGTKIIELIEV